MVLPLVPIAVAAGAGLIAGLLARQPEIDRLKKQVKLLQQEISRLKRIIEEQQRQIQELTIRYSTLKAYNFMEKTRAECSAKGAILHQCAYKEWLELTVHLSRGKKISAEQRNFYNTYEALIRGKRLADENMFSLRIYIIERYPDNIKQMKAPVLDQTLELIGDADAA